MRINTTVPYKVILIVISIRSIVTNAYFNNCPTFLLCIVLYDSEELLKSIKEATVEKVMAS